MKSIRVKGEIQLGRTVANAGLTGITEEDRQAMADFSANNHGKQVYMQLSTERPTDPVPSWKPFWILWSPERTAPNPTYRHDTEHSAITEAKRLATAYRSQYYVMECKFKVESLALVVTKAEGAA